MPGMCFGGSLLPLMKGRSVMVSVQEESPQVPPPAAPALDLARTTAVWERVRGAAQGVLEPCWQALVLIVAIRYFAADEGVKSLLAAGMGIGLTLSFFSLPLLLRLRLRIADALALLWTGAGLLILILTVLDHYLAFLGGVIAAQILLAQGPQLITHIYATNFAARERGRRLSLVFIIASVTGIGFSYVGGAALDADIRLYRLVFAVAAAAAFTGAYAFHRIPSQPLASLPATGLWENFSLAWRDKVFGWLLFGWMLMGLGNLMVLPLRVEYLANPEYGINLSNTQITALLVGVVAVFRILSTTFWGIIFDRLNVVTVRVILNVVFFLSILIFFNSTQLLWMAVGSALLGIAFGGGGIMWSLFVTKIAPPDNVPAYMSLHGFYTGLRAAAAPFIGYSFLAVGGPVFAAWIAAATIAVATLIFIPLRPHLEGRKVD